MKHKHNETQQGGILYSTRPTKTIRVLLYEAVRTPHLRDR